MRKHRSISKINEKIKNGKAVVMTATELCDIVRSGGSITMDDVDVVTSATRALMSGTMAILSFRVADKKEFERASEVYLDGVPCVVGPAPNENLGWIDCVVMGTAKNIRNEKYGGGHLFRKLVEGKEIEVKVKTKAGKEFTTLTSLEKMPYANMFLTRGVCALMVYTNPSSQPLKTIFSVNDFAGNLKEAAFSGCGELSPIAKDPDFHTFGVGTKILLNGSVGYILGKGTLSSANRRNFSGIADMHNMDPELMGGFKTSASPEVIATWAVPIPIVNEQVLDTACITDEEMNIPIVDVFGRNPLGEAHYSDVWIKDGILVKYDIPSCKKLRESCNDAQGNFICPPQNLCPTDAFSIDNKIDFQKCYYCGTCVAYCLQKICQSSMGEVTVDDKHIPVVLRHSDRIRAGKSAKRLKERILSGEFLLSEPVGSINFK
jgi:putative methanogenesis marker 16 metalloprotein